MATPVHNEAASSDAVVSNREAPSSSMPLGQRIAMLDGDDLVVEVISALITDSLNSAETLYIERRLSAYAARAVVDQLFTIVAACEPTLIHDGVAVFCPIEVPTLTSLEEPPTCSIDATCRIAIHTKDPPPRPMAPSAQRQSKRLLITASLAASTTLASSPAPSSMPSPRAALVRAAAARSTALPSASNPIPGVPFSTAGPVESPRKSVALLKTAMRLASAPQYRPSRAVSAAVNDSSIEEVSDRSTVSDCDSVERIPDGRRLFRGSTLSPTATTLSSSAWSITLPGDPSLRQEVDDTISASVDVEFVVPEKLPVVGRRRSAVAPPAETRRASRDPYSVDALPRRGTFLPLAEDQEAVEMDPAGMLGFAMREQLALSPGVTLHHEGGELVKTGPLLPDVPSKMRRATFANASLAMAALAAPTLSQSVSPTRPPERPSTILAITLDSGHPGDGSPSNNSQSGVFSLTECSPTAMNRTNESMRSLAISHVGSMATSSATTTSVKTNLFRKPVNVTRPCTAASSSSSLSCGDHAAPRAMSTDNEAIAELVKQRAFQRKPSFFQTSSPKKTASRRAVVHITTSVIKPSAASPLSRRSLLCKTPSKPHEDPLRRATKLL